MNFVVPVTRASGRFRLVCALAASLVTLDAAAQTSGAGSGASGTGSGSENRGTSGTSAQAGGDQLAKTDKTFIQNAAKSSMKEVALSQLAAERASRPQVREFAQQITSDHHQVNRQLMQLAREKGVKLDVMKHGKSGAMASASANTGPSHMATGTATTGSTTTGAAVGGRPADTGAGMTTGVERMRADASGGTALSKDPSSQGAMAMMRDDQDFQKLSDASGREFDQRYVELMVKEHEKAVELFEQAAEDAEDPQVRSFASTNVGTLREHLQEARELQQRAAAE